MTLIAEEARAKINLTLEVLGRRADGYHELCSLVVFANNVGDRLFLETDGPTELVVSGPMASEIEGENILLRAFARVRGHAPGLRIGSVHLEKRLPVAAGVGGGSANAGALLRALKRANSETAHDVDWMGLAASLGADVPVCFENRAQWMLGIGDVLRPLSRSLPRLDALLVNPRVLVPADKTARVFRALAATPAVPGIEASCPAISDRSRLLALIRDRGNDLAQPAREVVPEIDEVRDALSGLEGVEAIGVSGAGPTAFAIFADRDATERAQRALRLAYPAWWIEATVLG